MPFTNYLDQRITQLLFSNTAYTIPATWYIALSTTTPSQGATPNFTEPSGNGYARVAVTNNTWGWLSSYNTKRWALGELQNLLNTRSILIHDKRTFLELLNYVERDNGTLGNEGRSGHDDTVMALAIATSASKREGFFNPRTHTPVIPDIFTSELEQENVLDLSTRRFNERAS